MWFKNVFVYRFTKSLDLSAVQLEEKLRTNVFAPCLDANMTSEGWTSPRGDDQLIHTVSGQWLLQFSVEKKLLPSSVIKQVVNDRAAVIEEEQGFKPGRKMLKELKEQVIDELTPRAFAVRRQTSVWIDPVNCWLVVDASAPGKTDEVIKSLLKCADLPIESVRVAQSPQAAMTDWLSSDEAPSNFTVDQDTELRANSSGKASVRYVQHSLEPAEMQKHISDGKQCIKLALTWNDKISFVLTDTLQLKRIKALDLLTENSDQSASTQVDERFDTDFTLMAGEFNAMFNDVIAALGGLAVANEAIAA